MSLSHAAGAEHKQRVEGLQRGIVADGLADGARYAVAFAGAIVLESIARIELGIEIASYRRRKRICRCGISLLEDHRRETRRFLRHCRRGVVGNDAVAEVEFHTVAVHFADAGPKHTLVKVLELLDKEVCTVDIQPQHLVGITQRSYVAKPGVVLVRRNVVLDKFTTFRPKLLVRC